MVFVLHASIKENKIKIVVYMPQKIDTRHLFLTIEITSRFKLVKVKLQPPTASWFLYENVEKESREQEIGRIYLRY